ncbi:hypothetical protein B0T16DRAFT_410346 [Cercophora newfieldiana]|uniref:Secreted protein n=1 Tax=Cercophora newfieldiana TaxID=92897 RepID=A0AA39YDL8_9PEZI|nr:hypothetical protein B0T16DRAFT_410346 [Cercophora newfieldiana]
MLQTWDGGLWLLQVMFSMELSLGKQRGVKERRMVLMGVVDTHADALRPNMTFIRIPWGACMARCTWFRVLSGTATCVLIAKDWTWVAGTYSGCKP